MEKKILIGLLILLLLPMYYSFFFERHIRGTNKDCFVITVNKLTGNAKVKRVISGGNIIISNKKLEKTSNWEYYDNYGNQIEVDNGMSLSPEE
jgi:hypothetical protein